VKVLGCDVGFEGGMLRQLDQLTATNNTHSGHFRLAEIEKTLLKTFIF
jgi:hypothetical protein